MAELPQHHCRQPPDHRPAALPGRPGIIDGLRKVGGDTAKYALDNKLVDELATSTEVEKALTKQFGWSKADNNYRAISYYDYNVKTPSDRGSAIAVIFANGAIMDGEETRATSAAIPPQRKFAMRASIRKLRPSFCA